MGLLFQIRVVLDLAFVVLHLTSNGQLVSQLASDRMLQRSYVLCAALGEALSLAGRYNHLYIFCDCLIAVEWTNSNLQPSSDYQTVADIREMLQNLKKHMNVSVSWVPAHVGVQANRAAQRGAEQVDLNRRYDLQPLYRMESHEQS